MHEASNAANPLLERLKFLSIFESNLDEFYMVRVSGLIEQEEGGISDLPPDGHTPSETLRLIAEIAGEMREEASQLWTQSLLPELRAAGIQLKHYRDLTPGQRADVDEYFRSEVFPVCTPLMLDPATTVPFISNRSLNLVVALSADDGTPRLARVKVPTVIPRLYRLGNRMEFILLEEVMKENLAAFFPRVEMSGAWVFRVIRDADIEIRELEALDLISTIEGMIRKRRFGDPVLLEADADMPEPIVDRLLELLDLDDSNLFRTQGLIGLDCLLQLASINRSKLKFESHHPYHSSSISSPKALFEAIRERDILFHHPYDSFRPVLDFVESAAKDPDVLGIKQTLYRVGSESPIVEALLEAAENGKQVAVMVELKARFDESNNLLWSKALERAGVHVSYGFPEQKVHCKLCQVVRRDADGIRTYAHIGSGNYNPSTSRIYTDLGLMTCDPDINQDVSELFNYLTGFSRQTQYRRLLVAPIGLREGVLDRIHREVEIHQRQGGGRIILKLNALVDPEVIDALYHASSAGVQVDLFIRGISCCRPGLPGVSENLRVTSVVGRFLEHSRTYYFGNGGEPEALIGSADLMPRNLDRRIEVLTPVQDPGLVTLIHDELLTHFGYDTTNAWRQLSDGTYEHKNPEKGQKAFSSQQHFMSRPFTKLQFPRSGT